MSAYTDYIDSLSPGHVWHLDGTSTHTGSVSLSTTTPAGYLAGAPITKGATNSASFDGNNSLDYGDSAYNVGGPWFRRSYTLWATFDDPNRDSLLYNEGAGVRNMSLYFGVGGVPAYIADNDADNNPGQPWSQGIYGPALRQGIPYHMGYVWDSINRGQVISNPDSTNNSYMTAYLNGVPIQTKLIFQDGTNNSGGQLNSHSGNIELGLGQQIIISGQTFDVSNHVGLLANCAVWDGVVLTDAQMWELFAQGAAQITSPCIFENVPVGADIFLYELDALGGTVQSTFGTVIGSAGGTESINYTVEITQPARLVIVDLSKQVFSQDVTLQREQTTFPVDLLLLNDRVYNNP